MTKAKLLRRISSLISAICLALVLWLNFAPGTSFAVPRDIIDPDNTKEANAERHAIHEERARQNIDRDVKNESASAREHSLRATGDFAKGLITGIPPGSRSVLNAVQEVAKGCTTCHQPEFVEKLRNTLNKLGTSGQEERDKQKVLQRMRDWESKNPPPRPSTENNSTSSPPHSGSWGAGGPPV